MQAGLADDKFPFEHDGRIRRFESLQLTQQAGCGLGSHLVQRLRYGSQPGLYEGGCQGIRKTGQGYVFRDADSLFLQDFHGSEGDIVVEGEYAIRAKSAV